MTESQESRLFDVAAEGYDRLMGRYLPTLGPAFADAAGVTSTGRALDVGCGPGGMTSVLVDRLGAAAVAGIDPSDRFVQACRDRHPGVDVRRGVAEHLPYPDDSFDVSLACLVVGFMTDPEAGVREMRRVTRPGGSVGLCFWASDWMPLLSTFWRAVGDLRPMEPGEANRFGRRQGEIAGLLERTGCSDVVESSISGTASYDDFEDWWSSFTGGAGPVGALQETLTEAERTEVRRRSRELLGDPSGPFTLQAWSWCAVGRA
jgi:SAM-dependent methyltransferase